MNARLRLLVVTGTLACAALATGQSGRPLSAVNVVAEPPGSHLGVTPRHSSTLAQARFPCVLPLVFGNQDFDRDVDGADAQWILAKVAGFRHFPDGGHSCSSEDIDCDGDRDTVDALWLLRWVAELPYHQVEPCPDIDVEVPWL